MERADGVDVGATVGVRVGRCGGYDGAMVGVDSGA